MVGNTAHGWEHGPWLGTRPVAGNTARGIMLRKFAHPARILTVCSAKDAKSSEHRFEISDLRFEIPDVTACQWNRVIRHEAGSFPLLFEATLLSAYVNHSRATPFTLLVPCFVQGVPSGLVRLRSRRSSRRRAGRVRRSDCPPECRLARHSRCPCPWLRCPESCRFGRSCRFCEAISTCGLTWGLGAQSQPCERRHFLWTVTSSDRVRDGPPADVIICGRPGD